MIQGAASAIGAAPFVFIITQTDLNKSSIFTTDCIFEL